MGAGDGGHFDRRRGRPVVLPARMNANDVDTLVQRHLGEASGTLRDCPVNELNRGECTRRNYFIFKIDLVGSTDTLRSVRPATYARIAHTYLSTVDRITQQHGA